MSQPSSYDMANKKIFIVLDNIDGKPLRVATELQARQMVSFLGQMYSENDRKLFEEEDTYRYVYEEHSDKCYDGCYCRKASKMKIVHPKRMKKAHVKKV